MINSVSGVLLLGVAAVALANPLPEVRFDQGVNVKALLREAAIDPGAIKPSGIPHHMYWIPGCADHTLEPGVNETSKFRLSSTEVVQDCDYGYPGGGCRTTFGWTYWRDDVRLILRGRPAANPAERFTVCLTGSQLGVQLMVTPTRYDVSVSGSDVVLTARP